MSQYMRDLILFKGSQIDENCINAWDIALVKQNEIELRPGFVPGGEYLVTEGFFKGFKNLQMFCISITFGELLIQNRVVAYFFTLEK